MPTFEQSAKRFDVILWEEYTNKYYKLNRWGVKEYVDIGGLNPINFVKEAAKRTVGFFTGRDGPGPQMRKVLEEDGNIKINEAWVSRKPVFAKLEALATLVSNSEYDRAKEELNYDKMFHLSLVVHLENDKYFKIEKNEEVEISQDGGPPQNKGEHEKVMPVPGISNQDLTMNDLINRGEQAAGKSDFWSYDPVTNNCQVFVQTLLKASGLLTSQLNNFIIQNVAAVFKTLPSWSQTIVNNLPNFKKRLNILFRGVGRYHTNEQMHEIIGGNISKLKANL